LAYQYDWGLVVSGQYGRDIVQGLVATLEISGLSIVFALILGTLACVMRLSRVRVLDWLSRIYVEFFRNTPLLVQMFFWYFGTQPLFPHVVNHWLNHQEFFSVEFAWSVVALSFYTGAFIAEDLRSGIFAIPKTQLEASRACGLSFLQAMRYVVLPQAFRIIVPPLISQSLNLLKNSSLAMTLGVWELTAQVRKIGDQGAHGVEAYTVATVIYLCLSLAMSFAVQWYNRRVSRVTR